MTRFLTLALLLSLAACGDNNTRYLLDTAPAGEMQTRRMVVSTIEMRQIRLPAYAEDQQILVEDGAGALTPITGAIWADEPTRAMTQQLAQRMDRTSTATVAAEPWPLGAPAQVVVDVRVNRLVARAGGTLDLSGQFAIGSPDAVVRERIRSFALTVPLPDQTPAAIARATGTALNALADRITAEFSR